MGFGIWEWDGNGIWEWDGSWDGGGIMTTGMGWDGMGWDGMEWNGMGFNMDGKYKRTSPLCPHEFYVSIKNFCPLEDFSTISDRFPISALLRDRTLVLT